MADRSYFDFAEDVQLEALRRRAPQDSAREPEASRKGIRIQQRDTLVAVAVIAVVLLVVGGYWRRHSNPHSASTVAVTDATATTEKPSMGQLADGHVITSAALEPGDYPPDLAPGDTVMIVVTPSADSNSDAHAINGVATVRSIGRAMEGSSKAVVSLEAPTAMAVEMAAAGSVHIAVVGRAS